jgi:hypothetical protein
VEYDFFLFAENSGSFFKKKYLCLDALISLVVTLWWQFEYVEENNLVLCKILEKGIGI